MTDCVPKALSLVHYSSLCTPLLSVPSFPPTHFVSSIDHLHNALDRISSWMTANLLTLNSSETEFLLIGLSKQLAKINNSSRTTTQLETSASYLMNTSLFLTRSHLSPNLASTMQLTLSQPAQVSDHLAPTDPEPSCTCCCQSSQIQSYHSHPPVSTLAKDN